MRRVFLVLSTVVLAILLLVSGNLLVRNAWSEAPTGFEGESALSTTFTYQGSLTDNGQPADGAYDFIFALYPSSEGGSPVGTSVEVDNLAVSDGLFTVELDFEQGTPLFDGTAYWLEIRVRPGADAGAYTIMTPRQALTPTPYALYASRAEWDGLLNVPAGFDDSLDDDTLAGLGCTDGEIPRSNGSAWGCSAEERDISGISPGSDVTGTVDSGQLTLELLEGYSLPQDCAGGDIPEWTGTTWRCSLDDVGDGGGGGTITGVLPGYGLQGGGSSGSVTLEIVSGTIQTRVGDGCPIGSFIREVNQDGSVLCELDHDTTYAAGTGLELKDLTFTITSTYQLPQGCGDGEIARWDNDNQDWFCDADLDTTDDDVSYSEIAGIVGSGLETVAAGDHDHDTRYFSQTALINGTAEVDWANLRNIPLDLDNGDDDSLATLNCVDDQIVKRVGGAWSCETDEVGSGGNIGDITAVYGGLGLTGIAESGDATLDVGAGAGLVVTADAVGIAGSFQLPQSCTEGQIVEWDNTSKFWDCGQDDVGSGGGGGDITGVFSGEGLTGGGPSGNVTLTVAFAGNGAAGLVARSDHNHDGSYYTTTLLQSDGPGNLVHWSNLGAVPADLLDGDADTTYSAGIGLAITGTTFVITDSFQLPQGCIGGQIISWNGVVWDCADAGSGGAGWSLTGNTGTTAGTHFLGTTDDQALELRVNNQRGLMLEPTITSTNFVAGFWANSVGASVAGATIGGGGYDLAVNSVTADFGTVGGGSDNAASAYASVIDGGAGNTASGSYSAVGGGSANAIYGNYAAIGGGHYNNIDGDYGTIAGGGPSDIGNPTTSNNQVLDNYGTVSGGGNNVAGSIDGNTTTAEAATIGGGQGNRASAAFATAGGGSGNFVSGNGATVAGGRSNDASDNNASVAGGLGNSASGENASVGGGQDNSASGGFANVGGGQDNTTSAAHAVVSGGQNNSASASHANVGGGQNNVTSGDYAVVSGGLDNLVTDTYGTVAGGDSNAVYGSYAAISGGSTNEVSADYATVGGGHYNMVSGDYGTISGGGPSETSNPTTSRNQVFDDYGTISGGGGNTTGIDGGVPSTGLAATVGGGIGNSAIITYATSGGGLQNIASGYGATIAGGTYNEATANNSTVSGGSGNAAGGQLSAIGGGQSNTANGYSSVIGGGANNQVSAAYGTIPGGSQNYVGGNFGFAAGYQARAEHAGTFVWSDFASGTFASTAENQFLIQAAGGVGIGTNNTTPSQTLTVGGNATILNDGRLVTRGVYSEESPFALQKPSAIDSAGDYIYVTSSATNTLTIIDISDPDFPRPIANTTSSLHGPIDIQVAGGLAFIASESNNSLVIMDISDPSQPVSIGSSDRLIAKPQAVHVVGNEVYVASYGESITGENAGLAIFDVSDPTEPLTVGFTDTNLDRPSDVFATGDFAYVTSKNNDSLAIFDISNRIETIDTINIEPRGVYFDAVSNSLDGATAVQVRGSYAYILAENSGMLVILDISDPDNITKVSHSFTDLTHPVSLFLSGDYAYVAYAGEPTSCFRCGLAVFDVSDPATIQLLSEIDMGDNLPFPERPVAINGNGRHIYVVNQDHDSVTVYDVNHLSAPAVTAGIVQADELESMGDARIDENLSVGHGLNVGPGGALIGGQLSVAGRGSSYILGNLSLGQAGIVLSDSEKTQIVYPTQQLDVHGDARFRVNENHSLMIASPPIKGAFFDFTTNNFGAYYSPTARIEFSVPNPFTGTTHTTEVKILTQSAPYTQVHGRMTIGEEISIFNITPELGTRTTITFTNNGDIVPGEDDAYLFGNSGRRWREIYSAGGVIESSDERWKDEVTDLDYGLAEVNALRPVSYSWKEDPDGEMHYGLIAQEVLEILPEMVDLGQGPDDPLGLNYAELTPVLVSAIQEQQEQIESQADQITTLEERLSALEGSGGSGSPDGLLSGFSSLWAGALVAVAMVVVGFRRWPGGRS